MSKTLIDSRPSFKKERPEGYTYLNVAEFFTDTIQGEGVYVGVPASFLRLQGCTQSCVFCDTKEVWRFGNPYSIEELLNIVEESSVVERFKQGHHLVLTGGSPVLQQDALIEFIHRFIERFGFKPFIEIENECTIMPSEDLIDIVDCWNNSPKLENSKNPKNVRYRPEILKKLSSLENSWFKFVVSTDEEWKEIKNDFIDKKLISKSQIVLMPLGADQEELGRNREYVVKMAVREGVRYSTREHIVLWNKKTGV